VTALYLGAVLFGVFLLIVAVMAWQEARSRGFEGGPVYVVEDAVDFVTERLDADTTRTRLRKADVRRILEYEVHHLQGLAQDSRRRVVDVVAGGTEGSVDWIVDEIHRRHGVAYARDDVYEVLGLEAVYLVSIGAVGEPAGGDEG
jgi:hypothetical protein